MKDNDKIPLYKIILHKISNKMVQDTIVFNAISSLQKSFDEFWKITFFLFFFFEKLGKNLQRYEK